MKRKNVIFAIILSLLFILLTILVKTGCSNVLDSVVYEFIASFINSINSKIFKFITFFGSTTFIVILTIILLLLWRKSRRGVQFTTLIIISTIINNVLKVIIRRPRPEVLKLVEESTFSFPSGHTMAAVTLAGFLIYCIWQSRELKRNNKILLITLLIMYTLLIMLSRIYLGAHFITDVISSLIMSIILLLVLLKPIEKFWLNSPFLSKLKK